MRFSITLLQRQLATVSAALSFMLLNPAQSPALARAGAQTFQFQGHQLSYLKSGKGPAVVMIHGIGGHKEDWIATAATLAPHHTVYTIDMLGFGGSSKTGDSITIADQVAAIAALLDAEKVTKADLLGNSVGGWVAATFAATHPTRTNRLVLVDAAGFKAMFEGKPPVEFYPQTLADTENLLAHVRFDPAARTPTAVATALKASRESKDSQAAAAVGKGMFASERLEDVATRVQAPTLIIWGEQDGLFPTVIADLIQSKIVSAKKIIIPRASHFPHLDQPAVFNAHVKDFLN